MPTPAMGEELWHDADAEHAAVVAVVGRRGRWRAGVDEWLRSPPLAKQPAHVAVVVGRRDRWHDVVHTV